MKSVKNKLAVLNSKTPACNFGQQEPSLQQLPPKPIPPPSQHHFALKQREDPSGTPPSVIWSTFVPTTNVKME